MARTDNTTYTVTVKSWDKHNGKMKKGYEAFMLSLHFLDDPKIATLPATHILVYLYVLITCGKQRRNQVQITGKQVANAVQTLRTRVADVLNHLQQKQLLTVDDSQPLIKVTKELKKRRELPSVEIPKGTAARPAPKSPAPVADKAGPVIAAYCDQWRARYKTDKSPAIMPKDAKAIKTLVQQVGGERATQFVHAYLQMPDSWFVTKRHDIPTMVGNLNAITQFIATGKVITKRNINQLDLAVTNDQTLQALENGEV